MISVRFTGLTLFLAAAACGGDDRPRSDVTVAGDTVLDLAHEPATGMDRPVGGMATAPVQDVQGGTAAGEVTIYDRGGQTELVVTLTGLTADADHPGHIHTGTCGAFGDIVQSLDPIRTDTTGAGTANADLDLPPARLATEPLVVLYHGPDGQPLACAPVPRE